MASSKQQTQTPTHKQRKQDRKEANKAANKANPDAGVILTPKFLARLGLVGAASVASLGGLLMLTKQILQTQMVQYEHADSVAVAKAVLSGNPSVVYCMNQEGEVPQMVQGVRSALRKLYDEEDVSFLATNCFEKLDALEGKTIAERFNFGTKDGFLGVFMNGNPKPPQFNYLANADFVAQQIVPSLMEPGVKNVIYLRDYEECQNRDACVVLMGADDSSTRIVSSMMNVYQSNHRNLRFVAVNGGFYNLKTNAEFEAKKPEGDETKLACFVKGERALTEEEIKKAEQNGAIDIPKTKVVNKAIWGPALTESEKMNEFLEGCKAGLKSENDGIVTIGKHSIFAKPSEPKVVSRPAGSTDSDLGAGKEKVGMRPDEEETPEDDLDLDSLEEEEKVEEEVDL